jgi:hypothetical protein
VRNNVEMWKLIQHPDKWIVSNRHGPFISTFPHFHIYYIH